MSLNEKVSLALLMGAYALFSTMMPASLGVAELIVGFCLLRLVTAIGAIKVFIPIATVRLNDGLSSARIAMIILFFFPLFSGVIELNDPIDIARDVIALFFLAIPIAMFSRSSKLGDLNLWRYWFSYGMLIVGLVMSLRHFLDAGFSFGDVGNELILGGGLPLVQDPSVQFALSFSFCMAIWCFIEGKIPRALIMLLLFVVPLMAVLGAAARAPIGLTFISALLLLVVLVKRRAFSVLFFTISTLCVAYLSIDFLLGESFISGSLALLNQKTDENGLLNLRDLEVQAVFDQTTTISQLMFGHGWGSLIRNPVVSGASIRYVHNMFAYIFFKTGLVGFISFIFFFYFFLKEYVRGLRNSRGFELVTLVSLLSPLIVGAMLEATYKTMLFGFILFMILLFKNKKQTTAQHGA